MIFLDTSALVKRYIDEPGSKAVEGMFDGGDVAASILAYAETLAALTRRKKAGDLSARALNSCLAAFETDWKRMTVMPMGPHLLQAIKRVIGRYGLRGADAVHLASAIFLFQSTGVEGTFVASDDELLSAAKRESIPVRNPVW